MNNRRTQNIDGFALRRRPEQPVKSARGLRSDNLSVPNRFLETAHKNVTPSATPMDLPAPEVSRNQQNLTRSDLDASMAEIDAVPQPKRGFHFNKRLAKRIAIVLLIAFLVVGGYLAVKAFIASGRVFNGSLFDLLGSGKQLQMDGNGRTNILVFGTSEDDPSHEDSGGELADSIMVLSIDQKTKAAAMVSVPRDLFVKFGEACNSGYEGKINEVYMCGADGKSEKDGSEKLMDIVGDSYGLDMHYYVHVNYTVLRESVDAVGGIDVEIKSDDPRGILDRNFDWRCNFRCYFVKWPNGMAHLDGEQALALARARNAAGGYGLSRGNFDREQYQQKIMIALKDKAVSGGTLTNPIALNGLIDSLGNNVRTNFDGGEIKTLVSVAAEINNANIKRVDLIKPGSAVLTTGSSPSSGSIVRPIAGLYDFSDVQDYIQKQLTATASNGDTATVEVLNGSDTGGVAGKKAKELEAAGISEVTTGDTPSDSSYAALQWYDLSGGSKPKTAEKLRSVLGVGPKGTTLPSGVQSDADFVILLGNGSY